jgi:23S rRNA pseudouridine1911/1915/1917 synthase
MKSSAHEQVEDLEDWSLDYSGAALPEADGALRDAAPPQQFSITALTANQRLDHFLADQFPSLSRSVLQRWIAEGHVLVGGREVKPSLSLREGQVIDVHPPPPSPVNDWGAEPMALDILYQDADVIVVNKPAGLVVHPAAGHPSGTLVNGLIHHFPEIREVARAGIVHRLDRDTTGLMVAARSREAQLSLVRQLQERQVSRQYLALAWGRFRGKQTITSSLGRDPRDRQKMAVVPDEKGKPAITHLHGISEGELFGIEVSLIRCILETGRTHQIRVHLESIKHPIVGDLTYSRHSPHSTRLSGGKEKIHKLMPGQALHAQKLRFAHPTSGKEMAFVTPIPHHYQELLSLADIEDPGVA